MNNQSLVRQQNKILAELEERRRTLNYSYAKVAAKAGIPTSTVFEALTGSVKNPSFIAIEAIANAFGLHQTLCGNE